jgi:sialate O-acetylesterase
MEKPVGEQRGQQPTFNAEAEIKAGNHPTIRLFKVARARTATPAAEVEGTWQVCTPESLDGSHFSAAGYFFGRRLNQQLGVPVGLIDSDWGGTRIELWTSAGAFAKEKSLADLAAAAKKPGAKAEGVVPSLLYNGQIAPLAPFAIRGAIWYQGESNLMDVNDSATYPDKMAALVNGWRAAWGSQFSFYYVQIAPYLYHLRYPSFVASPQAEPKFWEAQESFMRRVPKTGMIVTTDLVDNLFDIHPRDKKTVGERLANWALNRDYGRTDLPVSGPVFMQARVEGPKVNLEFDHAEGLMTKDGKPPTWFQLAGRDGVVFPAVAELEGERVLLTSPKVAKPKVVRFAWDEGAQPNLFNSAGLPARPFLYNLAAEKSK